MKKGIKLLIVLVFLMGLTGIVAGKDETKKNIKSVPQNSSVESCLTPNVMREKLAEIMFDKTPAVWDCDSYAEVLESKLVLADKASFGSAISEFNKRYAEGSQLVLQRQEGDTVFVGVNNANRLTQQMGSAGASCFMGGAVYTLTTIADETNYVVFDFPEGDHARPGRYTRVSFPYLLPLKMER